MHKILVMQILRGSIRSHKFVSHYVSPTPYPLQATCMCKCVLQMFIQSSRFHTSMFFDISNRGAGDDFASLFLIYVLLTNSQRNKPLGYQSANAAVLHEIQQAKWQRERTAYTAMLDR